MRLNTLRERAARIIDPDPLPPDLLKEAAEVLAELKADRARLRSERRILVSVVASKDAQIIRTRRELLCYFRESFEQFRDYMDGIGEWSEEELRARLEGAINDLRDEEARLSEFVQ